MNSTVIRRNDLLARAAELGYPPVVCNAVVLANPAAWHARIAAAFDLELEGVAAQLDRIEAVAAARAREVEPGTAELLRRGAPMQSAAEYAQVVREREARTAHAVAERARRLYELQTKQLEGIE